MRRGSAFGDSCGAGYSPKETLKYFGGMSIDVAPGHAREWRRSERTQATGSAGSEQRMQTRRD
jgi:hypothetical protein